jgi:hypothetical protein
MCKTPNCTTLHADSRLSGQLPPLYTVRHHTLTSCLQAYSSTSADFRAFLRASQVCSILTQILRLWYGPLIQRCAFHVTAFAVLTYLVTMRRTACAPSDRHMSNAKVSIMLDCIEVSSIPSIYSAPYEIARLP